MNKIYTLIVAAMFTLLCTTPSSDAQEASDTRTFSQDAVDGAVLCWNEAGNNRFDCSAIIEMRMRSAAQRDRTFAEELHMLHGDGRTINPMHASLRSDRATNPREGDSRPWLGDIASDLHQPLGWEGSAASWEVYSGRFRTMFAFVQGVLDGRTHARCRGIPRRWGGPRIDAHLIDAQVRRGEVVIDCGNTRNVFLGRDRP